MMQSVCHTVLNPQLAGKMLPVTYRVCPNSHEIYFFAALLLVAACSNWLGEVGGHLSS